MKWKKKIFDYLEMFVRINTAVCIATAVNITLFWNGSINSGGVILWQIIIVSALAALCRFFYNKEALSKREELFRLIGTFVYINTLVLGFGIYFEWFLLTEWKMVVGMEVTIIAVFVAIMIIDYCSAARSVEHLNKLLEKREEEVKK